MRLIGTVTNEIQARRFAGYLEHEGIDARIEGEFDARTGHITYQIWVRDEDKIDVAATAFQQFLEKPSDAAFDTPILAQKSEEPPIEQEERFVRPIRTPFTILTIALCAFVFFLNLMLSPPLAEEGVIGKPLAFTPLEATLLFDEPPSFEEAEAVLEKYALPTPQPLPPEATAQLEALQNKPFWHGAYTWIFLKLKGEDPTVAEGPLFVKIRQGEAWRAISPVLLHYDILHILFNMIWVWVLSRPIEHRIGVARLFLLSLLIGVGSNIAQYLMSGPLFIGYSGIVLGLAGFTWMREKMAPWEGYPMSKATTLFLAVFVGAMFVLQASSFFLQLFTNSHFEANIANTAHIAGALIGMGLARLSFFRMRVHS